VPLLGFAEGAYMSRMVGFLLREAGAEAMVETVHESDIAEGLKAMALEGHGLAFLPTSSVRKELKARRLVHAAPPGQYELTMEIRLYRERPEAARHVRPAALALWDFLAAGAS
jgi:DNA-binding transcriptional LysR family regulator